MKENYLNRLDQLRNKALTGNWTGNACGCNAVQCTTTDILDDLISEVEYKTNDLYLKVNNLSGRWSHRYNI